MSELKRMWLATELKELINCFGQSYLMSVFTSLHGAEKTKAMIKHLTEGGAIEDGRVIDIPAVENLTEQDCNEILAQKGWSKDDLAAHWGLSRSRAFAAVHEGRKKFLTDAICGLGMKPHGVEISRVSMSSAEFAAEIKAKGWTELTLAIRWGVKPRRITEIIDDEQRRYYFTDAIAALPALGTSLGDSLEYFPIPSESKGQEGYVLTSSSTIAELMAIPAGEIVAIEVGRRQWRGYKSLGNGSLRSITYETYTCKSAAVESVKK